MPSPTVRFPDPPPPSPGHRRLVLTAIVIGTAVIAVGVLTAGRFMLRALSGETEITALLREVPEDVKPYRPVGTSHSGACCTASLSGILLIGLRITRGPVSPRSWPISWTRATARYQSSRDNSVRRLDRSSFIPYASE